MDVVLILLPIVSTLVGAGITYVINVRQRRRTYVEDRFNEAIAAVAAASASQFFINAADPTRADLSGEELRDFNRELRRRGLENEAQKAAEAWEALAKLSPYLPEMAVYYKKDQVAVFERADEIIALIRQAHPPNSRSTGRRWRPMRPTA